MRYTLDDVLTLMWKRRKAERIEVRGGEKAGTHYFTTAADARAFFDGLGSGEGTRAAEWRHWGTSRVMPELSGEFWIFVADYYTTTDAIGEFEATRREQLAQMSRRG